jgi:GTP-binding protein Era
VTDRSDKSAGRRSAPKGSTQGKSDDDQRPPRPAGGLPRERRGMKMGPNGEFRGRPAKLGSDSRGRPTSTGGSTRGTASPVPSWDERRSTGSAPDRTRSTGSAPDRARSTGSAPDRARSTGEPGGQRPSTGAQRPAGGSASRGVPFKGAPASKGAPAAKPAARDSGPAPERDRALTAGERNELKRQERRAARKEQRDAGPSTDSRGRPMTVKANQAPTHRADRPSTPPRPKKDHLPKTSRGKEHKASTVVEPRDDTAYRAGFACFVGRPNAGKSTLTNAIIGQKIAITSSKPQTTRHIIRGVLHQPNSQLVLVDTPGLHRPRTLLGERLNDLVRETWSEVDVIGLCFPADEPVGRGDRFISSEMAELKATVIAIVTKVDMVDSTKLASQLLAVSKLADFAEIIPVSAVSGHQVDTLVDVMTRFLPESPQLYPDDMFTDEPEQVLIAELIREAALEGVRDELPHSIAVLVEEMIVEGNSTKIYANLYIERPSQKSIIIGTQGARLKEVGTNARAQIETLLGKKVHLDLHVRVAKEWQRDPKQLRKLGF